MQIQKKLLLLAPVFFLLGACHQALYLEPMPQNANTLSRLPADIAGVYEIIPAPEELPEPGSMAELFKAYLVMERIDDQKMVFYVEMRMPISDMDKLRALLQGWVQEGKIKDYQLSRRMLWISGGRNAQGQDLGTQQIALLPSGNWLLHLGSYEPFGQLDLKSGHFLKFDQLKQEHLRQELMPEADSLAMTIQKAVLKRAPEGLFLNTETEEGQWQCMYFVKTAQDRYILNSGYIESEQDFNAYLKKNFPERAYQETNDKDILLDISDEAFIKMQQTPSLWDVMQLRKVE
ncbi:MAG: hypothetical protein J0L99_19615 [Chitinophagales bacterium]|nr:hypothetical protein [Chitinophagales bacterium]